MAEIEPPKGEAPESPFQPAKAAMPLRALSLDVRRNSDEKVVPIPH